MGSFMVIATLMMGLWQGIPDTFNTKNPPLQKSSFSGLIFVQRCPRAP